MRAVAAGAVPRTALVLIAAVSVLWGLNWPAMKLAVGELSPWTFRVACVAVAGGGLMLVARVWGERLLPRRDEWLPLAGVSLFSVTAWHLFSAFGLTHIEGGRAAVVAYSMPAWAALFSALYLHERLGARQLAALALGMAGVAVLTGPDVLAGSPLGPLLMTGAAVSWAAGIVLLKRRDWSIGIVPHTGWQLLLGGVPIVLAWLALEPDPDLSRLTWRGLLGAGYAATVALIFCFTAYNKIVTMLPATVAALSTLAIPVVGLVSSALLLGEPLGAREVVALALVAGSIGLVLRPRRAEEAAASG